MSNWWGCGVNSKLASADVASGEPDTDDPSIAGHRAHTLSLEQVMAVIDAKSVLGLPREIQEVRNAFVAYETMSSWEPASAGGLLSAHERLMQGLCDDAGHWRSGG